MRELAAGVRLLTPSDYRRMRWKNRRGWTTEIAVHPADADLNNKLFDWRVSLAEVETDCEFSAFPGYERTILLAEGAGMELSFDAVPPRSISRPYEPVGFRGEWQTHCRLLNGPVQDFNVISQREHCAYELQILRVGDLPRRLPAHGQTWLLHVFANQLALAGEADVQVRLMAGETLLANAVSAGREWRLDAAAAGMTAVLVEFTVKRATSG